MEIDQTRKAHTGHVVSLGAGKGSEARALAGGVIESHAGPRGELRHQVDALVGLLQCVECAESIAGAPVPVLVHAQHLGVLGEDLATSRLEARLPPGSLCLGWRRNEHDVECMCSVEDLLEKGLMHGVLVPGYAPRG